MICLLEHKIKISAVLECPKISFLQLRNQNYLRPTAIECPHMILEYKDLYQKTLDPHSSFPLKSPQFIVRHFLNLNLFIMFVSNLLKCGSLFQYVMIHK